MKEIRNMTFGGERPLFEHHDVLLDNVTITTDRKSVV